MDPLASRSFDWVCVASNLVDDYVGGWMNFARSMCLDLSVGIFKAAAKRQCAEEEAFPPLSSAKNTSAKKSSTKKSSAKRSSWQLGILQYPWSSVFYFRIFSDQSICHHISALVTANCRWFHIHSVPSNFIIPWKLTANTLNPHEQWLRITPCWLMIMM